VLWSGVGGGRARGQCEMEGQCVRWRPVLAGIFIFLAERSVNFQHVEGVPQGLCYPGIGGKETAWATIPE
jgi:hypothetical protein